MQKKVLTKKDAAEFLNISMAFLSKLVSNREITFVQVGKRVLFLEEDLIAWLKSKRIYNGALRDRDLYRKLRSKITLKEKENLFDDLGDYESYREKLYKLAEKYGVKK